MFLFIYSEVFDVSRTGMPPSKITTIIPCSNGTLAGSTRLLPDIAKILGKKDLFSKQYISNSYDYHKIAPKGEIEWDDDFNIVKISY